jgi:prepilin-type N-terminal cleavage/methylation domain-containing protein
MNKPDSPARRAAGFSLLELMVVIAVMSVIFVAVFQLMHSSLRASAVTYETTDAQQALRIAHEALSRDLYSAGDGLTGITDVRVPLAFARNYLSSQPDTLLDPNADGFTQLTIITSDDNVPAGTALIGAPSGFVRPATDRISLLSRDTSFTPISLAAADIISSGATITVAAADIGRFTVGEIYYLSNGTNGALGMVTSISANSVNFAAADPYGLNQPSAANGFFSMISANGTIATTLSRMQLIHYFVTDTGLLVRRAFGVRGRGHTDSVIAEHITTLNFRYVLNLTNPDGTLQQPVSLLAAAPQLSAVRQVEFNVTAETVRPMQNTGQRASFNATQQISIRNLQFREAQQPGAGVVE